MAEFQEGDGLQRELGISRRELIRRGAIVGGTLVWAAPLVQSIGPRAFAQTGTPACNCSCTITVGGLTFDGTLQGCDCVCCCVFQGPTAPCPECGDESGEFTPPCNAFNFICLPN